VLGVSLQTLSDHVFYSSYNDADYIHSIDRLDLFVSTLYSQLLRSLTALINRSDLMRGELLL